SSVNSERTIQISSVITELLERALHVDDYLVRQQIAIGVDGAIVIIPLIIGIVSPRRIPVSRIVVIVSTCNQHDNDIVLFPPIAVMPFMMLATLSVRVSVAIGFVSLPVPSVVNNCVTISRITSWVYMFRRFNGRFSIPGIVIRYFPMAGIIGDSSISARIVVCSCGLCRLNSWLLKGPFPCRFSFRGLLRCRRLAWRYLLGV